MKILLLGKGGQVGWELQRSLAPLGEVVSVDFDSKELCGDFTNLRGLEETVRFVAPHVIVNAAAYTAVDQAESDVELARLVNAQAVGVLARCAAEHDAWLAHYSTDYVFKGDGSRPWVETDVTDPTNVYGQTKLEGERLISASNCKHLIFRTSWVYAARGSNFAKTMIKLARERELLRVINDQYGAPTGAELLADLTAHSLRLVANPGQEKPELAGTYHAVAAGTTSWFEYAQFVIQRAKALRSDLEFKVGHIEPVSTSAFPTPAKRPSNSRMDTGKLRRAFNLTLPEWQIGVDRMLAEYLQNI
jgi:dTDP-4-dehydrorhamnose reductase